MFTKEDAEREVAAGIRFLRTMGIRDWAQRIDLATFNPRHNQYCTLGQIFKGHGGFMLGYLAFESWRQGIPFVEATNGGFCTPPDSADGELAAWGLVMDEWKKQICRERGE
jgi:hypothetical protein